MWGWEAVGACGGSRHRPRRPPWPASTATTSADHGGRLTPTNFRRRPLSNINKALPEQDRPVSCGSGPAPVRSLVGRCAAIWSAPRSPGPRVTVSYTHLRAHETVLDLVCRLLL